MTTETTNILRTKLYQPQVIGDLVPRPRLLERLEQRRQRPLTLVCAPAGYGKTTLVCNWLQSSAWPGAWLSLDEADNELSLFLTYVIAAIRTIFPEAGQETLALLKAATLPPLPVLVRSLINELDQLESPFVLVLDDYHLIREPAVHDLLSELLRHPLRSLHLVLTTRIDPPLNLARLRVRSQVTEIRTHDLRFTASEIATFLEQELGSPADELAVKALVDQSEGWVASLRLMILSLRSRGALSLSEKPLSGQVAYVKDYLLVEILEQLSPATQGFLLKSSILSRLCSSLCEAVTGLDDSECNGQAYLESLHQANLFTMPLDDRREWYRFHHLFQELLQSQLAQKYNAGEIAALHRRASAWFTQNGWLDEALHHALAAGDTEAAIQLAARHRHTLIDREEWPRLQRWLRLFSENTIDQQAELLIIKAYAHNLRGQLAELVTVLDQVEAQLAHKPLPLDIAKPIWGEIYALRANFHGFRGNLQEALTDTQRALELLPPDWHYVTTAAKMTAIACYHMLGEPGRAYAQLYRLLDNADFDDKSGHATLLLYVNCVLHWVEADLPALDRVAGRYLEIGQKLNLPESMAVASGFLGSVHYQRNNLAGAEQCLALVKGSVYKAHTYWYVQGTLALAQTYQALNRLEQARETVEEIRANLLEMQSSQLLPMVEAFEAELSLNEGRLARAGHWAKQYNPLPLMLMHRFYVPQLTLVKVWLAQDTKTSLEQAADLLTQLQEFVERTHNTRFLIEVLALQGLLIKAHGDEAAALDKLAQAIRLAEPGGFIRLFVDLGPQLARLLQQLQSRDVAVPYIGQILEAFPELRFTIYDLRLEENKIVNPKSKIQNLLDPLTERELEILALLARRLSNKEIAAELVISPGTVTQHTHNIYQKLEVKGRRQAVAKATDLGIFLRDRR